MTVHVYMYVELYSYVVKTLIPHAFSYFIQYLLNHREIQGGKKGITHQNVTFVLLGVS